MGIHSLKETDNIKAFAERAFSGQALPKINETHGGVSSLGKDFGALQELVSILQKPFQYECNRCSGSGVIAEGESCETCQGDGKLISF